MCKFFKKKNIIETELSKEQIMFDNVYGKIRSKMIREEGIKYVVYLDTLGKPTGGIGHLIRDEDNMKVGDRISHAQVETWFREDITQAIWAAISQSQEIGEFEEDFIIALTSVNFQLGIYWYRKWPNTYAALKVGNYEKAIRNVMGSLWNKQTPVRTKAFKTALLQEMVENNRVVTV